MLCGFFWPSPGAWRSRARLSILVYTLSPLPPRGIHSEESIAISVQALRGDAETGTLRGPRLSLETMAERTVPHAYPMSAEYEFANPSKIYDQNFGEGKRREKCLYLLLVRVETSTFSILPELGRRACALVIIIGYL